MELAGHASMPLLLDERSAELEEWKGGGGAEVADGRVAQAAATVALGPFDCGRNSGRSAPACCRSPDRRCTPVATGGTRARLWAPRAGPGGTSC